MMVGGVVLLFFGIFIIVISIVIMRIMKWVNGVNQLSSIFRAMQLSENDICEPKSVSGATDLYLRNISKDFPDFHKEEAFAVVDNVLREYLDIVHLNKANFASENVDSRLFNYLDFRAERNRIYNYNLNKIVISDYTKSDAYATIVFNVSLGYTVGGQRIETRYRVLYTFKLLDDGLVSEALICSNCGAALESTATTVCPYCDSKVIRDTYMSWKVSSIQEI